MGQASAIEWTDFTSNPLRYRDKATGRDVWACVKHSPGCAHCYSETLARRYGKGGPFTKTEMAKVEPYLDRRELYWLLRHPPLAGRRVFLGDMTDVFGEWVSDELLDRLFVFMALRKDVTFQLLTKRADRMRDYIRGADGRTFRVDVEGIPLDRKPFDWPLPNVWLGVSCEDRDYGLPRLEHLRQTPAAVRFVSVEPLIEDLGTVDLSGIHWCIIGGESGGMESSRPFHLHWARSLVRQCRAAGVACFVKQMGSTPVLDYYARDSRDEPPGEREWAEANERAVVRFDHGAAFLHDRRNGQPPPFSLRVLRMSAKGGNPDEWPSDLRVREFPSPRTADA